MQEAKASVPRALLQHVFGTEALASSLFIL
jgi:hypothetical protein